MKQQLISKLNKQIKLQDFILQNSDLNLFSQDEIYKIKDLYNKSKKLLNKLEKEEFEIAIVGLEKAGKSTFANALIESDVLPSAPERCTFTSTKIVYGAENKAVVKLYTEEEFNEIFKKFLEDLKYPNVEKVHFRTFSLNEFEYYFNSLEEKDPNLYHLHKGTTYEEIKDILKYRDNLELTGEVLEFRGDEIYSDKFKEYIKGKEINENNVDTSKPRSVKEISIQTNKLSKMQKAIIYDVPGFDSPTRIHQEQTAERLKNADAIIFVVNIGVNPNINSPQLSILRDETDNDGIPLKDKLFAFGNKLDSVNTESHIERNKNIFINEVVNKYSLTTFDRVFVGSALKYLKEKNLRNDDENIRFDVDSGIDEIRSALEKYYKTERMKVLKRRVDFIVLTLKKMIDEKVKDLEIIDNEEYLNIEKTKIYEKKSREVINKIVKELDTLKNKIKREFEENKYFSDEFEKMINNNEGLKNIDDNLVESYIAKIDNILSSTAPYEKIEHEIRKDLHMKYLRDFTKMINSLAEDKIIEVENNLVEVFERGIGENSEEIEQIIREFINSVIEETKYKKGNFDYLLERFARNVFDILLNAPVSSKDRISMIDNVKAELEFLGKFYNASNPKILIDELRNKTSSSKPVKLSNEEQIKTDINKDIELLKKILLKAILPAANLEIAFSNSINKSIMFLREILDSSNDLKKDELDNFKAKIINKLIKNDIEMIDKEIKTLKRKKEFLEKIEELGE